MYILFIADTVPPMTPYRRIIRRNSVKSSDEANILGKSEQRKVLARTEIKVTSKQTANKPKQNNGNGMEKGCKKTTKEK